MSKYTDQAGDDLRAALLGLGQKSMRKTHYGQLQQRLDELERFRAIVDQAQDLVFMVRADGVILDANATAARRLQVPAAELINCAIDRYLDAAWERLLQEQAAEAAAGRPIVWERTIFTARQEPVAVEMSMSKAPFAAADYYLLVLRDMTEKKQAEEKIRTLAFYDRLTGLPNRMLLKEQLSQALASAGVTGTLTGVFFLNIDRFKVLNDSLGYEQGDALLQQVAERLRTFDARLLPARIGGDKFAAMMPGGRAVAEFTLGAQRLLKQLARPYSLGGREVFLTISLGVAVAPQDGERDEALLGNAENAMYRAKEHSGNQCRFYTSALDFVWSERAKLEVALRQAVADEAFALVYQPQVEADGTLAGFEALVRWPRPGDTPVYPDCFIPLAEECGLILPLGWQIIEMALAQARRWLDAGRLVKRLAVNLSAKQLCDPALAQKLFELLMKHRLSPTLLELEITESAAIGREKDVADFLAGFRRQGITLALDDFGTGYSSLHMMRMLPIQVVKIDRSFIFDLTTNKTNAAIVAAAVAMAKSLGLEVVAEGVETREQAAALQVIGVDRLQGYLFSRPQSSAELDQWVWEKTWTMV